MNYYKKVAPNVLKAVFDTGVPFRSKLLSIFSPKTLYREGEFTTKKKTWYDITLDLDLSYYIERQIFFYDIYEPEVISFIDLAVDKEMKCLDLGTNIGLHTLVMSKNAKSVTSYEANPRIIERLRNNIRNNNRKNVTIVPKAIATEECEIEFFLPSDNINGGNGSLGRAIDGIESKPIKVKADELRKVLTESGPYDFIKIDVEGLEFALIQSAIDILSTQQTTLLFEYNSVTWKESEFGSESLKDVFERNGYHLFEIEEKYRKSNVPVTPRLLQFPTQKNFIVNIVALHQQGKMLQSLKSKGLL